ncbi:acylneuraminate cytidylyltransferase family protein [Thorsellia kenyensis]|uniref:Cytidylyltransferase domain-containing protein n=1 Tax=Thorsellia kenyensis TaxID=1549888 RepID=A0ABV6C9G4_9GAMM
MEVLAFLPCRKGSERIVNKNTKKFLEFEHGLLEIKINQLLSAKYIKNILISTNDELIIEYIKKINSTRILLDKRTNSLSSSKTSTDELIKYAGSLFNDGHILWTHVTSPFINASRYDEIICTYFKALTEGYDSLMTTTPIRSFLWDRNGPINYMRNIEKWPRTQTLKTIHEINSGVFLSNLSNYRNHSDRIGLKPYLYEIDKITGHDIDWEEDFYLAEMILKSKMATL